MNRKEEIESRLAAISAEIDTDGADIDALTEEVRALKEELRQLDEAAGKRRKLREEVSNGAGEVVRRFEQHPEARTYGAGSKEYRNAFLKNLLGLDMTSEERAAFVHTTANTSAVLPTTMLNSIWDLVSQRHAIMGDITIYRTGTILEVVKHTAIAQGAAKAVSENTAMERMSVDALERYLIDEISASLGDAMADDVISQIGTDMTSGNKVNSAANSTLTFKELAALFGKLKRVGAVTVYATRATIYNYLVGMVDTTGRPIFQPSAQAGQEGVILGAQIKVEDSVDDNVVLVGDARRVVYNMIQDIMIESDKDIKKHVTTYSGYARGSGALIDPDSFAQLTITTGSGG